MNIELSEELGIPKDLDKYAIDVLNRFLMGYTLGAPENIVKNKNGFYSRVYAPKKFFFGKESIEITYLDITLRFNIDNTLTDKIIDQGANVRVEFDKIIPNKKNTKIEKLVKDIPVMSIKLDISSTTTKDDVYDYLKDNFSENASIIAHELKHYIDTILGKSEKLSYRTKYNVVSKLLNKNNMLPSLKSLFFDMYFVSVSENLVRPAEFKTIFTSKKLTKKDFLTQYLKSDFYLIYKRIEERDYHNFLYKVSIDLFKKRGPNWFYAGMYEDHLLNVLELIQIEGTDLIFKNISRFADDTNYDDFVLSDINRDTFKDFVKKQFLIKKNASGGIDVDKTFNAIILDMQDSARKMKRKMAKVYAAIPDKY
jgi:hypothetical protein